MNNVWKRAWRRLIGSIALVAIIYILLFIWQGGLSSSTAQTSLLIDFLLFGLGLLFWVLTFSHFVLPLRKPIEALDVAVEMLKALLGRRPSAAFIQDGEQISGTSNQPARLLLLDGASAAVLQNESAYTQAIGPGLTIGRRDERIAGTLDLRKQRRSLGPHPEEDPFAPQGLDESPVAYQARQHRRSQTSALTRDNVEIAARMEVDLRVDAREGQGGSAFGFQPDAAWRAVAHEGVAVQAPSDARGHQLNWDWLPVHLAADLWREYLRKFLLSELFEPTQGKLTTLEFIEQCVNFRLQEAIVSELDERGHATGRQYSSPEYQLLRSRGLRVLRANLRELHLEKEQAEAQLLTTWASTLDQRSKQRQDIDIGKANKITAITFVQHASRALYQRLLKTDGREVPPPDEKETIELLLSGAIEAASGNQKLRKFAMQLKGKSNGAS